MKLVQKFGRFVNEPLMEKTESVSHFYWLLKTQFYYHYFFKSIGERSRILQPLRLKGVEHISIGTKVLVHKHSWLQADNVLNGSPELSIGDGSILGNFNHITCLGRVEIEENVLTADRVFITDHGHQFRNPHKPILAQGAVMGRPVFIGQGSWIGENSVIMSCHIGRNCVIGANSVVKHDIPDYSVAVGSPARVIRTYNPVSDDWERVDGNREMDSRQL